MYKISFFVVPALVLILNGCGEQPKLSREQWIKNTTRTYPGLSKEKAIAAASEVLLLADREDIKFSHNENGFKASRNWIIYLLISAGFGTDHWEFVALEEGDNLKVKIYTSKQAQSLTPLLINTGQIEIQIEGSSTYNLFWSRFEYLIGRRDKWLTCEEADDLIDKDITWGRIDSLCNNFNITNETPFSPLK